jgi:hypothetical protein
MPPLSPQAQALLTQFGKQPGVTPDQAANLQNVINGSPALTSQVNAAVAAGHLQHFALLPIGTHAGGTYNGATKTIDLPPYALSTPASPATFDSAELTFVLGHEVQHSFNHAAMQKAYAGFYTEAETAAKTSHDYTNAVGNLIFANRRDEAGAEVAGWNALVGMVKSKNPHATLADVYNASPRASDFVAMNPGPPQAHTLRPNLSVNPDLTMSPTAANIEGMGKNYFDKSPSITRLGHHGNSDYANYYGAYAIGVVSQMETKHAKPDAPSQITINMAQLHLSEKLTEENGINLGPGTPAPQRYFDSSTNPPTQHAFDHTFTSHTHIPIAAQEYERQRDIDHADRRNEPSGHDLSSMPEASSIQPGRHTPEDPGYQDHALLEKIRSGVRGLDQEVGKPWDEHSERLSTSALKLAVEMKFSAQDDVKVAFNQTGSQHPAGELLFVYREGRNASPDPAANRAYMPTMEALSQPAEQRYQQIEAVRQTQAEELQRQQQQVPIPGQSDPSQAPPKMSL